MQRNYTLRNCREAERYAERETAGNAFVEHGRHKDINGHYPSSLAANSVSLLASLLQTESHVVFG